MIFFKHNRILISAILLALSCTGLIAQTDRDLLQTVRQHYEEGRIDLIADLATKKQAGEELFDLDKRWKDFPENERIELFEKFSESFILLQDFKSADHYFLRLLKINPRYIPPTSSYELMYWRKMFRSKPLYFLSFSSGLNVTRVHILEDFGVQRTDSSSEKYSLRPSPYLLFQMGFPITRHLDFVTGLRYSIRTFHYGSEQNFSDQSNLSFKESQKWLDIPIRFNFIVDRRRFKPYFFAEGNYHHLLKASFLDVQKELNGMTINESSKIEISRDPQALRVSDNLSVAAGFGLKIPVQNNYLFFEIGFTYMIFNLVNEGNRYANAELVEEFGYVDNDVRIQDYFLGFGFNKLFYHPNLKRKYKHAIRQLPQ